MPMCKVRMERERLQKEKAFGGCYTDCNGNEYIVSDIDGHFCVIVFKDGQVAEIPKKNVGTDKVSKPKTYQIKPKNLVNKEIKNTFKTTASNKFELERLGSELFYYSTIDGVKTKLILKMSKMFCESEYDDVYNHQKTVIDSVNKYSKLGYETPMEFGNSGGCIDVYSTPSDHPFYNALLGMKAFQGDGESNADRYSMRM